MVVKPTGEAELDATEFASGALPRISSAEVALNTYLHGERFLTLRRLGAGGMGVVYEAYDAERKTSVALKTLSRLDAVGVYEIKNEFRTLAGVRHPNIIALHELYADANSHVWFFCMDLVHGVPFDAWVRGGDERRVRDALGQLMDAVNVIHAAGKLHRDLKPSNVLVDETGRVVVLDFGMASDLERGGIGQTVTDYHVHGTPAYMSPEQAAGARATVASDYYGVGVMLFEALTGVLPFAGAFQDILIDKQTRDAPVPSAAVAAAIPSDLDTLCAQLLSRDPAVRAHAFEAFTKARPRAAPAVRAVSEPQHLFGREREFDVLRDAYVASCEGDRPVVMLVAGESGIGKSALISAFLHEHRAAKHAVILRGRCYERESVPFKGFDAVVDDLSRYLRRLTLDQVNALLPRDASALRRLFPVLGRISALADVPDREFAEAREERLRAFAAFGELLARVRDRRPLIIHLDDIQWSDEDSTRLLIHLLRQPDAPRCLLIASHRDEEMDEHPYLRPLYDQLPQDRRLDVRTLRLEPRQDSRSACDQLGCRGCDASSPHARGRPCRAPRSGS